MRKLIVWLAIIGVALSPAVPVLAEGGIGGRPAAPNPDIPRSQSIFIHALNMSQSARDQLYVNNASSRERTISLYAVDGEVTNTGAYSCKQRSEDVSGSAMWIRLDKNEVKLGPGGHEIVDFTITVPQKTDVGEHNACIVMEDKHDEGVQGSGVRLYTRQAVRVVTTIPGNLKREVALSKFSFTSTNSQQAYDIAIANTGNVSTDVEAIISMKDMFGREVYRNGGSSPVLAGTTLHQQYNEKKTLFWGGWYTAQATLKFDQRPDKYGIAQDAQVTEYHSDPVTVFVAPTDQALMILVAGVVLIVVSLLWISHQIRRSRRPKVHLR